MIRSFSWYSNEIILIGAPLFPTSLPSCCCFFSYVSGLTLRESRKKASSHQLYLTGELEREPGDSRPRLILTTPDAGSYILIGTKAGDLAGDGRGADREAR